MMKSENFAETLLRQVALPKGEISIPAKHFLQRLPWISGAIGMVFLVLSVPAGQAGPRFFFAYLTAYIFFLSISLGALIFVLVQFACRAGWSVAVRRLAEHGMGTLPWMALLALPLIPGLNVLFPWFDSNRVAGDELLVKKAAYLNPGFFYLRSFVYLAVWSMMGWWFRTQSIRQDVEGDVTQTRRLQNASPLGIVLFAVTVTFASFDWIMSLDPHWYSTIFGVYFFSGSLMAALAFLILTILVLQRFNLLANTVTGEHFHDLGKLLFGFLVFWAYIAFSQFMLIWYANIPEETIWYAHRLEHGWQWLTLTLAVGHFGIPFLALLPRWSKRNRWALGILSSWLLFTHFVDLYWLIQPSSGEGFHPELVDLTTMVGVGGLFVGFLAWLVRKPNLVPLRDPRLAESISFENV